MRPVNEFIVKFKGCRDLALDCRHILGLWATMCANKQIRMELKRYWERRFGHNYLSFIEYDLAEVNLSVFTRHRLVLLVISNCREKMALEFIADLLLFTKADRAQITKMLSDIGAEAKTIERFCVQNNNGLVRMPAL